MARTTLIRDAGWVVAWDAPAGQHVYLRDADVVFSGNLITHVGRGYAGDPDEMIDGRGLMVMPGLVDIHSHPNTEPFYRGIREEHGVPAMFMSGLYERSLAFRPDMEGRRAGKEVAYCEMLLTGITTVADLSGNDPADRSGGTKWAAASSWHLAMLLVGGTWENNWDLKYVWHEAAGQRNFRAALALIDEAQAHPSGRLSGIVTPTQIDTCTEQLLRESWQAATEKNHPSPRIALRASTNST